MAIFKGAGVALVTPFHEDESINYKALERLIEGQIEGHTDAIIVCGTTGEPATMTEEERLSVIDFVVKKVNKRVPVIAGTGCNNTRNAVVMAKAAEAAGSDALSLINTITGMKIDIHKKTFALANKTGGLSGPAIKPVAVRMVYQVANAVKIPVVGMGGISKWQDAVEMLMAGATALQIGTVLFNDPYAPIKINKGLNDFLDSKGMKSVTELTGTIKPW